MKKALIVTRVSGFVPQFEMNHVRLLQQMGFEVHYAANFDTIVYGKDNSRLDGTGIVCHHIGFCRSPFSKEVVASYRSLKQLMKEESFDLIHCHMPMTGVLTRIAAQALRRETGREIPVMYTAHGFHFYTGAPLKNWIYYLPERFLARYTDRLVTMNKEDYGRACGFKVRGKAEKIPGVGIVLEDMVPLEKDTKREEIRKKARAELGVAAEEYLLISVGELTSRKNHREVLQMLAEKRMPGVRYMICGSGPLEEELTTFVKEHGLEQQVILTGYCSEVDRMLKAADCFVFPSFQEGLPMAVMEAMRAGLPVIGRKIRGNTDLIEDGKGGILLEKATADEYQQAITRLQKSEGASRQMGQWNQKQISNFSVEQVTTQMKRIYEEVMEESTK